MFFKVNLRCRGSSMLFVNYSVDWGEVIIRMGSLFLLSTAPWGFVTDGQIALDASPCPSQRLGWGREQNHPENLVWPKKKIKLEIESMLLVFTHLVGMIGDQWDHFGMTLLWGSLGPWLWTRKGGGEKGKETCSRNAKHHPPWDQERSL